MRVGRVKWDLRYAYFPNYSAPLLDKMVRFTTTNVELGGQAAAEVTPLDPTVLYLPYYIYPLVSTHLYLPLQSASTIVLIIIMLHISDSSISHYVSHYCFSHYCLSHQVIEREGSFAVHTTCFEHVTKVQGLKAVNAFWNPSYYDPYRPTITKPIMYMDDGQVEANPLSTFKLTLLSIPSNTPSQCLQTHPLNSLKHTLSIHAHER